MWCSTCHQDVPAIVHPASRRKVCSRCQRPLTTEPATVAARICDDGIALDDSVATKVAAAPPVRGDDWKGRQRVRNLSRELRRPCFSTASMPGRLPDVGRRFDAPQSLFDRHDIHAAPALAAANSQPTMDRLRRSGGRQIIAWLVVVCGTLGLFAGIAIVAWSLGTEQMIYWNLALALTLGGQGMLILGLVLVVSRLWRSSRTAVCKLQEIHVRLAQLQHTAEAIAGTRSGGAPAFYAELARGASPQMLLANLKSQVEQLAARFGTW